MAETGSGPESSGPESSGPEIRVDCPAKVNLYLEVLAKRSDGFHEIETLMAAVSVYDTVTVTGHREEEAIQVECNWASGLEAQQRSRGAMGLPELPQEKDNLVYRAATTLQREAGIRRGAFIRVTKRIPSEAGLGGGSSDAAATILALNSLWQLGWSRLRLMMVAAELGSDIPFFLLERPNGALAGVCRGRGEAVTRLVQFPRLALVLIKPPEGLSTADVYRNCRIPQSPRAVEPLVAALRSGDRMAIGQGIFNRLQDPAEGLSPQVRSLRQICESLEVMGHGMSGSGSSYFALCRSANQARQLASRLRSTVSGLVFSASTV